MFTRFLLIHVFGDKKLFNFSQKSYSISLDNFQENILKEKNIYSRFFVDIFPKDKYL